ncbi:hypothetical protein AB0G86_01070 [Streptomyces scabiei]
MGMPYGLLGIVVFLRLAGLEEVDDDCVRADRMAWGGADVWAH